MDRGKFLKCWHKPLVLAIGLSALMGCYHATVETGLAPSVMKKNIWAHSWFYGLVSPSVVEAQSYCESGVAKVETQLGFVTQLVGILTFSIYTPMEIVVTCASARTSSDAKSDSTLAITVPSTADQVEVVEAFSIASEMAVENGRPAYVIFQ